MALALAGSGSAGGARPLPSLLGYASSCSPACVPMGTFIAPPRSQGLVPAAALDVGSLKTSPGESECDPPPPEFQVLTKPSTFTSSSCSFILFFFFFHSSLLCVFCPGSHCNGLASVASAVCRNVEIRAQS